MHGQNPVRKSEHREDGALQVHEVFFTLQGEGPFSGSPAVFVRLSGCNLRCWFCDTHWDDIQDPYHDPVTLANAVQALMPEHCELVVITGGEPMRQRLAPFIAEILSRDENVVVQLETAGTLWQEELLSDDNLGRLFIVVSPKTPTVVAEFYDFSNLAFKYVIRAGDTFPPAYSTQSSGVANEQILAAPPDNNHVYLSPCDEGDPIKNLANLMHVRHLALQGHGIAGVQLHKLLEIP